MRENYIRAILMFGGGFLLFYLLKPKDSVNNVSTTTKNADGPPADPQNAEIVAMAYTDAIKAGEPPQRLTELNKETMKEFGMRAYVSDNQLVVCDAKGNTILRK